LAIRAELHLLDLGAPVLVIDREDREGSFLIIFRIKQVHLLGGSAAPSSTIGLACGAAIFEVEACEDHAGVVEAGGARLVDPDLALLALVVPHARRLVTRTRHECAVRRVQVDVSNHIRVPDERAQNVVIMETPVHDALVVVSF